MTTHMIRVYVEQPKGNAESAVQNWVENYTEWTADPVTHGFTEANTKLDQSGTTYLRGDWRFIDQGEDPTAILDDLSGRLETFQGGLWHRLGYHACDHDEDTPTPCAWEQSVESGNVPSEIPTLDGG